MCGARRVVRGLLLTTGSFIAAGHLQTRAQGFGFTRTEVLALSTRGDRCVICVAPPHVYLPRLNAPTPRVSSRCECEQKNTTPIL